MRHVKFIKAHPVGIPEGKEAKMTPTHAQRMVDAGYAEYIDGKPGEPTQNTATSEDKAAKPKSSKGKPKA
ncbi:hypothetical protein JST56_07225 [Candidatus Dependentiae bacterium]|nr:hypothetical protein [Candidatus Dependentiae bacterium]